MTFASWSGTTEEREDDWKRKKHQLPLRKRTSAKRFSCCGAKSGQNNVVFVKNSAIFCKKLEESAEAHRNVCSRSGIGAEAEMGASYRICITQALTFDQLLVLAAKYSNSEIV